MQKAKEELHSKCGWERETHTQKKREGSWIYMNILENWMGATGEEIESGEYSRYREREKKNYIRD